MAPSLIPLSIVIPTSNREQYCKATIRSVLAFPEEFELVVCDSGEARDLERFCADQNDPRLVYVKCPPRRGMTADFEHALAQARGAHVSMIGDDDGITPALFAAARYARGSGVDSITSTRLSFQYNWPDFSSRYTGVSLAGRLLVTELPGQLRYTDRPLERDIRAFLATAGQGCGLLPRVYHGLVSRRLVERMRERFGSAFAGVSPDVSFSLQAALETERHVLVNLPLTISGTSGSSNAGRSARREHVGELWSDPHMKHYRHVTWPDVIPEFFSVETVWAQASFEAARRAGEAYARRFSLLQLYSLCLLRHPRRASATLRALGRYTRDPRHASRSTVLAAALLTFVVVTAREGLRILGKVAARVLDRSRTGVHPAPDIFEASALCRREMSQLDLEVA